jgi:hypothetical protein
LHLLDFAWSTATGIARRDYDSLRVILDSSLDYARLAIDQRGYVLYLPLPRRAKGDIYLLHGLYLDADEASWGSLWRLFKASLYHLSLHAAYSDFRLYAPWAKGRDLRTATYAASLVEDYRVTLLGASEWPGLMEDISYANYIAGLRARPLEELEDEALRFASLVLLSLWGLQPFKEGDADHAEAEQLVNSIRGLVKKSLGEPGRAQELLQMAAQEAYGAVAKRGFLRQVPTLPYAEQHGPCELFDSRLLEREHAGPELLGSAYEALGQLPGPSQESQGALQEALELRQALEAEEQRRARLMERYGASLLSTKLEGLEFPKGDYGMFLRVRAALAGPIRTIRDQLRQVKQALDETEGHESGQIDVQAAMQVLASNVVRNDVFTRFEPVQKEEAWAILIDASRSVKPFSYEAKGIATCLAEVANELIRAKDAWALFAFNSRLHIIKDFEDEFDMESRARIGGLVQGGATLLPDAIEVCSKALASRGVETKILVVASDGHALGYEGIERRLLEVLKKVSRSGILLLGIGISSAELENYFLVNCTIQDPYQLMKYFVKSYLQLSSLF